MAPPKIRLLTYDYIQAGLRIRIRIRSNSEIERARIRIRLLESFGSGVHYIRRDPDPGYFFEGRIRNPGGSTEPQNLFCGSCSKTSCSRSGSKKSAAPGPAPRNQQLQVRLQDINSSKSGSKTSTAQGPAPRTQQLQVRHQEINSSSSAATLSYRRLCNNRG